MTDLRVTGKEFGAALWSCWIVCLKHCSVKELWSPPPSPQLSLYYLVAGQFGSVYLIRILALVL